MSLLHRGLALAGVTAVAAGLMLGSAAGASAAGNIDVMSISGSFTVVDDDFFSDPVARSDFNGQVVLSPSHPSQIISFTSACAGDEVRATLSLELIRLSTGKLYVQDAPGGLGLKLYEGTENSGCPTADLDGSMNIIDMTSFMGTTDTRSTAVGNQDEGGDDRASVSFRVAHT